MGKHLQEIASGIYTAKTALVAADMILVGDSAAANGMRTAKLSDLVGIPAANIPLAAVAGITASDVQGAIAELQGDITDIGSITGQLIGTAATFAALPTAGAGNGDYAILTADDGTNDAGLYAYNGTAYSFAASLGDNVVTMVGATTTTAGVEGLVPASAAGDQTKYLRGDGTWQAVSIATEALQATLAEGNTSTLDIEFTDATKGVILRAAGGTRYRVTIDDTGSLVTTVAA